MSIDTGTGDETTAEDLDRTSQFDCGICGNPADATFLASYPTVADATLSLADRDGCLALCENCIEDVRELTDTWTATGRPPVGDAPTIAASYRAVADDCSFCGNAVGDGPTLGVESWSGPTQIATDRDAATRYALCTNCVSVFDEFLRGIRPE